MLTATAAAVPPCLACAIACASGGLVLAAGGFLALSLAFALAITPRRIFP